MSKSREYAIDFRKRVAAEEARETMSDWTDALRERCRDTCAEVGDPPCYELHLLSSDCPEPVAPCEGCLRPENLEPTDD